MGRFLKAAFAAAAILALGGCISYETRQSARFIDNDGRFLAVEYQSGDGEHVNTYEYNGATREFKSKLRVVATLPDGESFTAYNCLDKRLPNGTLYRTEDSERFLQAFGTVVRVWKSVLNNRNEPDYLLEYEGVMCQPEKGR